jgi:hypothetical protein
MELERHFEREKILAVELEARELLDALQPLPQRVRVDDQRIGGREHAAGWSPYTMRAPSSAS